MALKYLREKEAHQISNYTKYDRYPDLFLTCQSVMSERKNIKILSYGCSTGEEVFTLRSYFPDAHILGVDINKYNIKKANRHNKDRNIMFSHHIKQSLDENSPFDIIFALAVLQRTENRNENTVDSNKIYPFNKFNAKLSELNRYVKSNGLLVIDHSDYRLEDAEIAMMYRVIKGDHNRVTQRFLYDRNNNKMSEYIPYHRIFMKTVI